MRPALFLRQHLPTVDHLAHFRFASHFHRDVHEITHNAIDFAAYVADFGKFRRLNFDKRGLGEFGQAPGNLGFANTRGADHQNIFRCNLTS